MQLQNDCHVLVCDGGKYLLLQNVGDEDIINLQVVEHMETEHQRTLDLNADRPGGFSDSPVRRGGGEVIDLYEQVKQRFIKSIVEQLEHFQRAGKLEQMVLVADHKSLGFLRDNMSEQLREIVIAEMAADHAHETVEKIEKAIVKF